MLGDRPCSQPRDIGHGQIFLEGLLSAIHPPDCKIRKVQLKLKKAPRCPAPFLFDCRGTIVSLRGWLEDNWNFVNEDSLLPGTSHPCVGRGKEKEGESVCEKQRKRAGAEGKEGIF